MTPDVPAPAPEARSPLPGDPLRRAAEVMHAVRERCVWSQAMTHRDLVPYLQEEAAEVVDAVESGSRAELREELGDVLWQVLFHAEIASEDPDDPFDIDEVARTLTEKMVRRHPHVFGDVVAATPEEVLVHWNAAKAAEKHERTSVLDGVSAHMPTLALAQKLLSRAAALPAVSVAPPRPASSDSPAPAPAARLHRGVETAARNRSDDAELQSRGKDEAEPASEAELGEALLGLVAVAREHGWDAERALRERLRALAAEVRAVEADAG